MEQLNKEILEKYRKKCKKYNLLYVEDDVNVSKTTKMVLEMIFKNVFFESNGEEGLNFYNKNYKKIDMILSDINMPKMDGIKMSEEIRKKSRTIPIILLTAFDDYEYTKRGIEVNITSYIEKPFDINVFFKELEKIIMIIENREIKHQLMYANEQYQKGLEEFLLVSKTDANGKITYVNDSFVKIFGYSKEELIGKTHKIISHYSNKDEIYKEMWNTIKNKKTMWKNILKNKTKDNEILYQETIILPILDKEENIIEFLSLRKDLTNILNPNKLMEDLVLEYKEAVVIYYKIEDYSNLAKVYEKEILERIEDEVYKKIKKEINLGCETLKIYKLGEGKIGLVKTKKETTDCQLIYRKIKECQKKISEEKILKEYDISLISSISCSDKPMENAMTGLKKIIKENKNFIISDNLIEKEKEEVIKNMKVLEMVKTALKKSKIISYYQPIINNKTKEIEKYESLVRLINEEGEVISPFYFLEISKNGKYYSKITEQVFLNSFKSLDNINEEISINLSILDIEKEKTRNFILDLLNKNKEKCNRVVFELLEDEEAKDFKKVEEFIIKVKKMGVKIAIDDFGTGFSNFEKLLDYKPDIIKIDGSLIKDILKDELSLNIVETIVMFAKKQKLKIVAEYVENEEVYNKLKEIGVDYSQGYYFGKPKIL